METKAKSHPYLAILFIFIVTCAVLFILNRVWNKTPPPVTPDYYVLMIGNIILFVSTSISFYLSRKALGHSNIQAFLRMVYSGMFLKMGICIIAAFVYAYFAGDAVSKTGVLGFFALYCIYTFAEVKILMRLSKQQKNG